jgi:hypothetical protein
MRGGSSPLEKAQEIDRSVFDAVAGRSSPLLDKIMPALSIAASFLALDGNRGSVRRVRREEGPHDRH